MGIRGIAAGGSDLRNGQLCITKQRLCLLYPEVDQLLENAFAEIGLIHPLQITPADVRVLAQYLYAPVFFGVLLHFLTQRHKCFKKLWIFNAFLTGGISLSGQCQMFECKAKTVQKCAVFRLISARQLSEDSAMSPNC